MMVDDIGGVLTAEFDWLTLSSDLEDDSEAATLYLYGLPDSPDFAVSLDEYGGLPPDQTMTKPFLNVKPRLQVIVRSPTVDDARRKAKLIFNYLPTYSGTIGGIRYKNISPVNSAPEPIGPDSDDRFRVSCNFQVDKDNDNGE